MRKRWALRRCGERKRRTGALSSYIWETEDHYDLGDNEFHLAFTVDDFEAAHAKHQEMGCICFENEKMGIYFITDPDEYWLEIVPVRK